MAKILVCDDSMVDRAALLHILTQKGHAVIEATDGADGVAKTTANMPDLVFMDVVMPNMDGFAATREITRNSATAAIPVVICSSKSAGTDKLWAKHNGAKGYLVKPATADQVEAILAEFLK